MSTYMIALVYSFCAGELSCAAAVHSVYKTPDECQKVLAEQREFWKKKKLTEYGLACLKAPIQK